jgi:hypothetical protein
MRQTEFLAVDLCLKLSTNRPDILSFIVQLTGMAEAKLLNKIKLSCAAGALMALACASSALGADGALLSDKASYPLLRYDYAPSADGKTFTLSYGDLVAEVNACNVAPTPGHTEPIHPTNPVVSQVSTVVLPLRSAGQVKMPFIVSGYAATGPAGRATLLINVNGTTKTVEFSANADQSFLETLDYASASVAELRVTFVLLAECDAYLSIATVDSDLAAAQNRKPTKRKH